MVKKKAAKEMKKKKPVKKAAVLNKKTKKPAKAVKKNIKSKKPKPIKKIKKNDGPAHEFAATSLFKAKIKVIGIGGGGGSIVSEIGRTLAKATFVVADTDLRALRKKAGIKYFWFGQDFTRGLGTGVNPELAKQAAAQAKEKISNLFKDQDIIIFIASLGGGLGSGATQIFAEAAKEFGGITLGIFTLPFKFEGKNKQKIANDALKQLRPLLNVSITIPNERIFKIIDANTPITDAFSMVNKNLIESLESLIDLIYNPGVINIDFADLRTILKGRGNLAFLNTVEQSGKERAEDICKKILVNPLYQNSHFTAEKILYNISGGDNLSMFEVEKISRTIADLNPKAKIIFGISKNSKLKNKIKTTLLMTGESQAAEELGDRREASVFDKDDAKMLVQSVIDQARAKPQEKNHAEPKAKARKTPPAKKPKAPKRTVPAINVPIPETVAAEKKVSVVETVQELSKKPIRRSALDIKRAQELEEEKRIMQEKEWEIPAFLRKVKFKS